MKKLLTLFVAVLLTCCANTLTAQCLNDTFGQWPGSAYTPTCNGLPGIITTVGFAGEYSVVNVTNGTSYTFSSSILTDIITISDIGGTVALASGTGSVTWTANLTGQVRFWTHTQGCGNSTVSRSRIVTCGTIVTPNACNNITMFGPCPSSTKSFTLPAGVGQIDNNGPFLTPGNEAIFEFTPPSSGVYTIDVVHTGGYFIDLFFKSGACSGTGWTYVDDIFGSATNFVSLTGGVTYLFMVDDEDVLATTGTITITCPLPAPDPCTNIATVTCGQSVITTLDGSPSAYNVNACGFSTLGAELIYSFTAPTSGFYTFTVAAGGTPTDYFDYFIRDANTGCGPNGWTCIDDVTNATGATVILALNAGTYYILVDKENFSTSATVTHNWSITCPPPCMSDFSLTAPFSHTSTTVGAGNDCVIRPSEETQYEITIPFSGCWTFSMCSTAPTWDSYMYLTDQCCFGTLIAEDDDGCGFIGNSTISNITLAAGTYYLTIEGFGPTDAGAYTLDVTGQPGPSNDECANATPVIGCSFLGDNTCSSGSDITSCTFGDVFDVWYAWVAPCDGIASINTCSPDRTFDTALSLWDGCGGTELACNDDFCGLGSEITATVVAGTTYLIRFSGFGGAQGTSTVNLTMCDTVAPVVNCPNVTVTAARGECDADVTFAITATDNCTLDTITYSISSGSTFGLGCTAVTATASDLGGNSTSCTFNVCVLGDSILTLWGVPCDVTVDCEHVPAPPPIIACPTAPCGNGGSGSGHHGSGHHGWGWGNGSGHHGSGWGNGSGHHGSGWGNGSGHHGSGHHGSGNGCGNPACNYSCNNGGYGSGQVYNGYNGYTSNPCTNGSGSNGSGHHGSGHHGSGHHGSGHHGSGWGNGSGHHGSGHHGSGNHGSGCGNNQPCNVYCVNNSCGVYATSLCGPCPTVTMTQTIIPGGGGGCYTIIRTWTAVDNFGNSISQSQTITVEDDERPNINCPNNITVCVPMNNHTGRVVNFTVSANDNCGTPIVTANPASGSVFPIGNTWVTATANDGCGNTRTCQFRVRVERRHNCNSRMAEETEAEAEAAKAQPELMLEAYPNPTNGQLEVVLYCDDCDTDRSYELILADMYGKVILKKTVNVADGRATAALDLSDYSAGMYLIQVHHLTIRVMKQ